MAVGDFGRAFFSPDGVSWAKRWQGEPRVNLNAVARGADAWVAVGAPYAAAVSRDGQAWEKVEFGLDVRNPAEPYGGFKALAAGGGKFVAVGSDGLIALSQDGRAWAKAESGTKLQLDGVAYGNGVFAAFARDGSSTLILTSPDGRTWTPKKADFHYPDKIAFGNGTFLLLNAGLSFTSPDGNEWTQHARPPAAGLKIMGSLDFVNGTFVATGVENRLIYSKDGIAWTRGENTPVFDSIHGVAYGGSSYVAVGDAGTILQAGALGR